MIVSFFTSNIFIQTAVFVIASTICLFATKPLVKKISRKKPVKTNAFSIIGRSAIVIKDIDPLKGKGQIKVDSEVWSAESEDETPIAKHEEVKIVRIDGVKAVVCKK